MARQELCNGNGSLRARTSLSGWIARFLAMCALAGVPAVAAAAQITLSWDPPDSSGSIVGYKLHSSPAGQPFAAPTFVGNVSSHTLTGLNPGAAYRAAVSAYDEFGQEGPLSAEVVFNAPVDAGENDPPVPDSPLLFADTFADGTVAGAPSWKALRGTWSVVGAAKRFSSTKAPVSLALIAAPAVRDLGSGRIEAWVSLTRSFTRAPDARIVFHYQDAKHYRYVRLTSTGISVGQVGAQFGETAGVKATLARAFKLNTGYRVRIDIADSSVVNVYLNGSATPVLSYPFGATASGRVGCRTDGARSLFDNVAVWSEAKLH